MTERVFRKQTIFGNSEI
ncbi:gp45 family putative tail fiber system protein, partial [Listeria monocytogenes]|nr:hypothetical protein [Listeria monocytogenes]EAE5404699.1 hypothetical protein [Listeria monocytogenes]EKE0859468.1 hypothetical protein [Listeria monocytogenes]EKE0859471.1 hypothetical protein [Listeria monocytogenes]